MNGHNKGRHYRVYRIDERLILTVLSQWQHVGFITLPRMINVPDGYEIHAVEHRIEFRGFAVLVWHPSFPEVPEGMYTPMQDEPALWDQTTLNIGMAVRLERLWRDQSKWSQATFGTDAERGPVGPLKHLQKEAGEAIENTTDHSEFADCFLLILDAARRAGMSFGDLLDEAEKKQAINRERKWEKPVSDEPVFHEKAGA